MTAVASELRLAAVQVCGYRAFPVPIAFQLARHDGAGKPLGKGRNLLLFGENGSGKSSFGKAIRDFLDYKTTANAFDGTNIASLSLHEPIARDPQVR